MSTGPGSRAERAPCDHGHDESHQAPPRYSLPVRQDDGVAGGRPRVGAGVQGGTQWALPRRTARAGTSCCRCAGTTREPSRSFAGPSWAIGSTGRWTGSTPSRKATTSRPWSSWRKTAPRVQRTYDKMARARTTSRPGSPPVGYERATRLSLMLGNQVELWESMLAIMKLGAVIMPTTTAIDRPDLVDRIVRAEARQVICDAADVACSMRCPATTRGSAWARPPAGPISGARRPGTRPVAHPGTAPGDRLLLYFTSGTTSRPKLVEHTQVSYPVGHLSTMYWLGLQPGDVHLNISSPGWAKHAWSCFFAPWIAQATILVYNYKRFDAAALLGQIRDRRSPRSARRRPSGGCSSTQTSPRGQVRCARSSRRRAAQPRGDRAGSPSVGTDIRDGFGQTETTAQVGNTPGSQVRPGSMGRPLPGVPVVLVDPVDGEPSTDPVRGRSASTCRYTHCR